MKILVALISLVLIFTIYVCCTRCKEAEAAVKNGLEALKHCDFEKINEHFGTEDNIMDLYADGGYAQVQIMREYFGHLKYSVISSSKSGDTATVKIKISSIDMVPVMQEMVSELFGLSIVSGELSEEEMQAIGLGIMIKLLSREEQELQTTKIKVKLSKKGDRWIIKMDKPFLEAIFGDILIESYIRDLMSFAPQKAGRGCQCRSVLPCQL